MQNQKGMGAGTTPDNPDSPRGSLTGFAATVVVLLVLGFAALFIASSHTIQVIGFGLITLVAIVCLIEFRPKRSDRRLIPLRARTNYLPGTGRIVDPEWAEEPGPGDEREPESRRARPGRGA
jgi:predicted lipid-binding transport protein (Tim44 family)